MTSRAVAISVPARTIEDHTVVRAASASYTRTGASDARRTLGCLREKEPTRSSSHARESEDQHGLAPGASSTFSTTGTASRDLTRSASRLKCGGSDWKLGRYVRSTIITFPFQTLYV